MGAEHSTGPQLVKVGETDHGEFIEEVGLGGADTVRVLGASAKGAAGCHAIIVWATTTEPNMRLGYGEVIRSPHLTACHPRGLIPGRRSGRGRPG